MKWRIWVRNFAVIGLLALVACAKSPLSEKATSAEDATALPLVVNGKMLPDILVERETTDKILEGLFKKDMSGEKGREELKNLLADLDSGKGLDDVKAFRGVCGLSTAEFVRAVLNPNGSREIQGLIGDFVFEHDGNLSHDGFKYHGTWPGHLTVDMKIAVNETVNGRVNFVGYEYYHWHIDVVKEDEVRDGFEVRRRQGDKNNPDAPFPGTVEFPPSALDPDNESSIWGRNLDHKLWAKGPEIVVRDVYYQPVRGQLRRLEDTHEFYKTCEESCIDMMTEGFPPRYRIDFPPQSGYCLGRCASPFIVNSK